MHKLIFILIFSIGVTQAQSLPMVKKAQFKVGNFWVWDIGNEQGLFSREKYTVVAHRGSRLTIEMSTAYSAVDSFHLHHRFSVDLKKCEGAYPTPMSRRTFTIDLARFENGTWAAPYQMHSRAFEEKFNCNAHFYDSHPRYRTDIRRDEALEIFKQVNLIDPSDQINGWYALEGPLAGIMVEKTFNEGSESEFLSRLSEWRVD